MSDLKIYIESMKRIEVEAFEKDGNSEFYKYVKFAIRTAEEHLFLMGGKNE